MSTPRSPQIDRDLLALAASRGLNLGSAKVAGEWVFFVYRGRELLLDGNSLTRAELVDFLHGEAPA